MNDNEQWIVKTVEGTGRDLISNTILAFAWRDWGKPRETSASIINESSEIQTQNKSQEVGMLCLVV
jgi:hypothetical protein